MRQRMTRWSPFLLLVWFQYVSAQNTTPVNFKVAFIGDQGITAEATAVLQLILSEGAGAVMHAGDFDYKRNPSGWEDQLNNVLGPNFPYFACMGEDDASRFFTVDGYQDRLEARMNRIGVTWDGDLGVQSSFHYQGIFFVQTAPGVEGDGHDDYIEDQLASTNAIWRISTFHKNQTKMQICGHGNASGWEVYKKSRQGGAIITTGQCHVYARTHLLSDMKSQVIASTSDTLVLSQDLPGTADDEGRTFAIVSGLGGKTRHGEDDKGPWWATRYSNKQDSQYGALFGVFNYNGDPSLARFYFKNIDGEVIEEFYVKTAVDGVFGLTVNTVGSGGVAASPEGPVYADGTPVTVTASPSPGWEFTGWSGDLFGTQNPANLTMTSHKVVIANFTELPPPEYTLTLSTQGAGSVNVDPPGNTFIEGTVLTLTAVPQPGFALIGWSGDVTSSDNPLSLTMDTDKSVTASFVQNDPPIALGDQYQVEEDNTLTIPAPGVLANDTDPDANTLQASVLGSPANGSLTLGADGSFTYLGNANFHGSDSLTYTANDGVGGTDTATVSIVVTSVEDSPISSDDVYFMEEFKTLEVASPGVLQNDVEPDGDPLTATLVSGPSNGSLSLNGDGSFSYAANPGFLGTDIFRYAASDGKTGHDTSSVEVTVNPVQITHEETVAGSASASASVSTSGIVTAVNGRLYLAAISSKPEPQVTQVAGLGLTWTRVQSQCSGRGNTGVEVWMAQGLPASDGTVTATLASSVNNVVISVSRYSGVDRDNPIQATISGNTNGVAGGCSGGDDSDAYSFDITNGFAGSVLYAAVGMREKVHTPGEGLQERIEVHEGGGGGGAGLAISDKTVSPLSRRQFWVRSTATSIGPLLDWKSNRAAQVVSYQNTR